MLLTGSRANGWVEAAERVAKQTGLPLEVQVIDGGEITAVDRDWAKAYGVSADGAVLVRPDAFVAWRSAYKVADQDTVLADVLTRASGLPPEGVA